MAESYFKPHIKGDTFNGRSITYLDPNNNPVDLTNVEVLIQFKYNSTDNTSLFVRATSTLCSSKNVA
jgi:hypothetical protein